MKKIVVLSIFVGFSSLLWASELSQAYQKEFTFLKAQKDELNKRVSSEKAKQTKDLNEAQKEVKALQNKYLKLQSELKTKKDHLSKLNQKLADNQIDAGQSIKNVVNQARISLEPYGISIEEGNQTSDTAKVEKAFVDTLGIYDNLSSLRVEKGKFYLPDGSLTEGDIVKVGNIAAYGVSEKASGALAPAGNGHYKLWNKASEEVVKALFNKTPTSQLEMFVYENLDKEVEYQKEKTLSDTIKAGGTVGLIILGLGLFGLLLIVYRAFLLLRSGSNVENITNIVVNKIETKQGHMALDAIKNYEGSTARVIKATLRNIDKDRDHIEDIVTENILNESSQIDRFGNFVLVIAAVAPLLGLLGTVTGMISTFDIITEYGTGDPKLLSGGISEALVTTMLGLIVAIPLLLLGNLLSGWAQNIKDSMEQSALRIVNLFEMSKAK
jgi:biopolymer transport protein ExbB